MTDTASFAESDYKVLLMINKRGFRHTRHEQNFIASQVNWAYDQSFVPVAEFMRSVMQSIQSQITDLPREKRRKQTETTVILSREPNGDTNVIEKLYHENGLNVEVDLITEEERKELGDILDGKVTSAPAASLASYLADLATSPCANFTTPVGTTGMGFFTALSNAMSTAGNKLIPLNMEHRYTEDTHRFKMTVCSTSAESGYVGRLELQIA